MRVTDFKQNKITIKNRTEKYRLKFIIAIAIIILGITVSAQQASTYEEAIVLGDELFLEQRLDDARSYYQIALKYKSHDIYANSQISNIFKISATQPTSEDKYLESIDKADKLFKDYKFSDALLYYNQAISVLPNDSYAQGKINRIKEIQADLVTNSAEFNQLITDGITFLNNNKFAEAEKTFKKARKIIPDNKEVKLLISKVKLSEKNYYSKQDIFSKEVELAYNYLNDSNYIEAIRHLNIAQEIEPENWAVANEINNYNMLAINQLNIPENNNNEFVNNSNTSIEINQISTDESNNLSIQSTEHFKAGLLSSEIENSIDKKQAEIVDMNKKRQEEIDIQFNPLIILGDSLFELGFLEQAIIPYLEALELKPEDISTQEKITKIYEIATNIVAENTRKYNTTIINADRLYKMKSYDKAIDTYRSASCFLPEESYPNEMVFKIMGMMKKNIVTDVFNDKTIINSDTTRVFAFEPVSVNVRRSNYLYMKATNLSGSSFKIIVSYGSNNGKNGGFVVQIPEGNQYAEYIIRVGNQYKWFADENNWISIQPEKGNIEIDLLRISKSY